MSSVALRLKQARETAGLNQGQLADKTGFNRVSISRWERGKAKPLLHTIVAIGFATNHNPNWIETGDGDKWLTKGDGAAASANPYLAPGTDLDMKRMETAIIRVVQAVGRSNRQPTPERLAAGILAAYDSAKAEGRSEVTNADVEPLIRLLTT